VSPTRLVVVAAIVVGGLLVDRLYRRWTTRVRNHAPSHPRLPERVTRGADRTWVVFTTPYCATCGPVEEQLRASDPGAHVVRVDATREPALAEAFSVRAAPTVLLADAAGEVTTRLVGAEAVDAYVRNPA